MRITHRCKKKHQHVLSISSCTLRSRSFRGLPMMNLITVLDVPNPPSPSPAPFLLLGWLAYVARINDRRSYPVSILNTPTNIPAGESESRLSGGNDLGVKFLGDSMGNDAYGPKNVGGGSVEYSGIVQYPRQGSGCLSGLQRYIMK